MHDTATEFVVLVDLDPDDAPRALVFTTTGCLGQIGMNELGVAVGINNLTGADGRPGVTWPMVVRKALEQPSAEAAKDVILAAPLAGAHNYLVFDATGAGYNIEAMPTASAVTELGDGVIVHTNHTLDSATTAVEVPRPDELQRSSEARLTRARGLLADGDIDEQRLMAVTRDDEAICQVAADPFRVESCGAAIMRPATGDFWAVWGLPTDNDYERFSVAAARA
jgi:isopenicillin-N N-acyltransferase-like protein